jgi:hypothetical protein
MIDLKQTIEELRRERELIDEAIEILEALMKRRLASVPEPRRRGTPPGSNRTRRGTENTPEPNP